MHFNIYLDDKTAEQLQKETKNSDMSRNAIIRQAISSWLQNKNPQWPEEILNYQGEPNFPAFESHREELAKPNEDPLA